MRGKVSLRSINKILIFGINDINDFRSDTSCLGALAFGDTCVAYLYDF